MLCCEPVFESSSYHSCDQCIRLVLYRRSVLRVQVAAREAHGAAQVVYTTPGVASRDPEDACFSECGVMNM